MPLFPRPLVVPDTTCVSCGGVLGKHARRGRCARCYRGGLHRGELGRLARPSAADRFWSHVNKRGPVHPHTSSRCWEWTASTDTSGYGLFRPTSHAMDKAHRWSWEQDRGPIPVGMQVLHTCDNRRCVRPSHLFLGTLPTNMADRNQKARQARGERAGRHILTDEIVLAARAMRRAGSTYKAVAGRFNVNPATMTKAITGRSWKHLPGGTLFGGSP